MAGPDDPNADEHRTIRHERTLRESEEMFRTLSEHSLLGIAILQDDRIRYINEAFCSILEVSAIEAVAAQPADIMRSIHPDDREFVLEQARRKMRGDPDVVAQYSYRVISSSGNERWVEQYSRTVTFGGETADMVTWVDVTRRRQAEQALRESERWLYTTLQSVGDGVLATDDRGLVVFINPGALTLLDLAADDAIGRPIDDVYCVSDERSGELLDTPTRRLIEGERQDREGLLLHLTAGARIPISESLSPIRDRDEGHLGAVLVFRDVSQTRQLEAQARQHQKLESIGTLASGVAHEINNPITAIMNYATLLDTRMAPEHTQLHEFAREIVSETERVASIVQNLLAFARQETQQRTRHDMNDIVESVLSLIRTVVKKDQITLRVDLPAGLPPVVCRSQQIQQVLMNLVTNARDALNTLHEGYDPDKVIGISAAELLDADGRWVRVTVRDRGHGIPADLHDRIFDPFFTTKPRDHGTGLGLSVSYGIVRDHHGRLTFDSQPDQGTRFHVDLPVDAPQTGR